MDSCLLMDLVIFMLLVIGNDQYFFLTSTSFQSVRAADHWSAARCVLVVMDEG